MVSRGLLLLIVLGMLGGCGRAALTDIEAEQLRAAVAAETGDTNTLLYIEKGEIQIRSGGQNLTVNQTTHQARPDHLPADIILPPDARIDLWTEGPRGDTLSCLTDQAPATCISFFRDQWTAQGWEVVSNMQADRMEGLTFQQPGRLVSLTLEPGDAPSAGTRILIFIETPAPDGTTP